MKTHFIYAISHPLPFPTHTLSHLDHDGKSVHGFPLALDEGSQDIQSVVDLRWFSTANVCDQRSHYLLHAEKGECNRVISIFSSYSSKSAIFRVFSLHKGD